jgi:chemotaxis protein methyltransferase CheR
MTVAPGPVSPDSDSATVRLLRAIEQRTGLSRDTGLPARLARALRAMPSSALPLLVTRLETLPWDAPEWQALIANVLVHETYLFRDWTQLDHLSNTGIADRIAAAADSGRRTLRVWSAGCSSGEEAYSIAAVTLHAMLEAGVATEHGDTLQPRAGWHLEVTGSDISLEMLARAEAGVYATTGLSPFRAMRDGFGRLFPADGPDKRVARADLRARVRFIQDNLLIGPAPIVDADVVLCRNVLVWFGDQSRRVALTKLAAAVAPLGYLLLGPTDPAPPVDAFEAIWSAGPVIYRRRPAPPTSP